jgi:hypothetical protein
LIMLCYERSLPLPLTVTAGSDVARGKRFSGEGAARMVVAAAKEAAIALKVFMVKLERVRRKV